MNHQKGGASCDEDSVSGTPTDAVETTALPKKSLMIVGRVYCLLNLMPLPYKISTLLYCFNRSGEALLLRRRRQPNRGLWSPCGGKLEMTAGESPHACACREAGEEAGLKLKPADLHLTGLVSEHGYQGRAHWLMFLFEVGPRLAQLPPPHQEGDFAFFTAAQIASLPIPQTDAEQIWPLFWRHRGGFFAAHCHCLADGRNEWTLEESILK